MNLVKKLKTKDEYQKVIKSKQLTVIDIYADWCRPCIFLENFLESCSQKYPKAHFFKMNVGMEPFRCLVKKKLKVEFLPTYIFYIDGKEHKRFSGVLESKIERIIMNLIDCENVTKMKKKSFRRNLLEKNQFGKTKSMPQLFKR